ncbi:MAG: HD domain-containing protein [Candidatus Scalindua sp.]|nr:HD domain-containing protein [Candidatus Scalindua sp.]
MGNKKFFPVSTENLQVDTILSFRIYIQTNNKFVLFRKGNHPFSEETLYRLIANRVTTVYISEEDMAAFEKYYHEHNDPNKSNISTKTFTPPYDQPDIREKYFNIYLNYFPAEKNVFIPGIPIDFTVYQKNGLEVEEYFGPKRQGDKPEPIPDDIHASQNPIVIKNSDISLYRKYLKKLVQECSSSRGISTELHCGIVRENSKLVIKEVLDDPKNGNNIQKSSSVVETLVDNILGQEKTFYNLMKITSYDYYTYNHSLNVCTLSIGLGILKNLKRNPDLFELGLGALLHDVGKSLIDPQIINKPGKLTDEEYIIVQGHVAAGTKLLEDSSETIPKNSFFPVLQHHEKISGFGYPYKLKEKRIHLFGRITAIVDFYDAMVTDRPYRKALEPFDALKLMSEYPDDYDQVLMKDFVIMLGEQS